MSSVNAVLAGKKGGLRVGYALVALLLIFALFGAWIAPYDATLVNLDDRLLPASTSHWLGTDHLGRDVLSRLIVGTQWSLAWAGILVLIGLIFVLNLAIRFVASRRVKRR